MKLNDTKWYNIIRNDEMIRNDTKGYEMIWNYKSTMLENKKCSTNWIEHCVNLSSKIYLQGKATQYKIIIIDLLLSKVINCIGNNIFEFFINS